MSDAGGRVRVAAVGDLHTHATPHGVYRPLLEAMSARADVLVLCGDLTNVGLPEEAENLAADLAAVRIPVLAVLGNHDFHNNRAADVKAILKKANVQFLDDDTFEHDGVGFVGAKGFGGGFGGMMLNAFGEDATKHFVNEAVNEALALENALKSLARERVVVALHYSPIPETIVGEPPEIFPFMGCARLGETIDRFEVRAVFHGHAHHGAAQGRTPRGAPVYNCCIEVMRRVGGEEFVVLEV